MKQTKQTNSIVRLVHLPMLMADMIQEVDCCSLFRVRQVWDFP